MKLSNHSFQFRKYQSEKEFSEQDQQLIQMAIRQLANAYAPYSNFHVGAALLLNNGKTFSGCNQENASYPLCMCAERVALYNAASTYPEEPVHTIAIVSSNPDYKLHKTVAPCGACRQVISEFEIRFNQNIRLILIGHNGILEIMEASQLLPLKFDRSFLQNSDSEES